MSGMALVPVFKMQKLHLKLDDVIVLLVEVYIFLQELDCGVWVWVNESESELDCGVWVTLSVLLC